ncbi:SNF2 family helicase [[Clostridium] leptum]|nr:SNF2 family helicase [[Clostridium] leptum]
MSKQVSQFEASKTPSSAALPPLRIDKAYVLSHATHRPAYFKGLVLFRSGMVHVDTTAGRLGELYCRIGDHPTVTVHFHPDGTLGEVFCPACYGHVQNGWCEHGVAAVLALLPPEGEEHTSIREEDVGRMVSRYTHLVSETYPHLMGQSCHGVHLYPRLTVDQTSGGTMRFFLELSIGKNRKYAVRSVKEFCGAFSSERAVAYGKELEFVHVPAAFVSEDRPLIGFVRQTVEEWQAILQAILAGGGSPIGRRLLMTPVQMAGLMPVLAGREVPVSLPGRGEDVPLLIQEGAQGMDIQMKFSQPEGERLTMTLFPQGKREVYCRTPCIMLWGDRLVHLSDKDAALLLPALDLLDVCGGQVSIPEEYQNRVLSTALPALEQRGWAQVDGTIHRVRTASMTPRIWLDRQGSQVLCKLQFDYGVEDPSALPQRDLPREEHVIGVLVENGFRSLPEKDHYVLNGEENLLRLAREGVGQLQEVAEVYVTAAFKSIRLRLPVKPRLTIKREGSQLLIGLENDHYTRAELWELLQAVEEKKPYHRLPDGSFAPMDNAAVQQLSQVADVLHMREEDVLQNRIQVPAYLEAGLESLLSQNKDIDVQLDAKFTQDILSLSNYERQPFTPPDWMTVQLWDYQTSGVKWMKALERYGMGGILADEMGLGKTLQATTLIASGKGKGRTLIVCPTSLVYNWKSEVRRFAPELSVCVVSGNAEQRAPMIKEAKEDVMITSYDLLRRDISLYRNIHFHYCFIDEAQYIKNHQTQNAISVKQVSADIRYALTGTPVENTPGDLWSIFDFIMPGYLGPYDRFKHKLETPILSGDEDAADCLRRLTSPFILRRMKKDVLDQLPPKLETAMACGMTTEQRKLYAAYLAKARNQFETEMGDGGEKNRIRMLALLTRLRQLCAHPGLFVDHYRGGSGKLDLLLELIQDGMLEGHRILIFSQFAQMLHLISDTLQDMGISHFLLEGNTPSQERVKMVESFNKGEAAVFLLSLKAGGTGLNLTGADTVIHFDPWWNPAVENQATDRAHRIGQKKVVHVIRLYAENSVEERILDLQNRKRALIDQLISSGDGAGGLDLEDLRHLFS